MVVAASRSPAPGVVHCLLAAALLLTSITATGVAAADSSTLCDTAKCGRGTCSEVPGVIPGTAAYNCTCDPGWSQPLTGPLFSWMPCMVPNCTFDSSCYNFSFLFKLPGGIPILDPCVADPCGSGKCKAGIGGYLNYTCDCPTGTHNVLNQTKLPCMKDCSFGDDCSKVGLGPPAPPPHSSATAPPPGSALSWRILQQLLSPAILLLLQIV